MTTLFASLAASNSKPLLLAPALALCKSPSASPRQKPLVALALLTARCFLGSQKCFSLATVPLCLLCSSRQHAKRQTPNALLVALPILREKGSVCATSSTQRAKERGKKLSKGQRTRVEESSRELLYNSTSNCVGFLVCLQL